MSAKARMTEIKTAMLLSQPFFASLLLDLMSIKVGKFPEKFPPGMTPTMATDGVRIWVDEDFVTSIKMSEGLFAVCHEIGHAMWQHMARARIYVDSGFDGRTFVPLLWNIAGDYVINDMLNESKVGKMPKFVLHSPKYKYTTLVDDVYRDLIKQNECKECGGTGKKGGGKDEGEDQNDSSHACEDGDEPCPACNGSGCAAGGKGSWDNHIYEPQTGEGDGKGEPSTAEWRRAVQSAKDAAKAMGKMPASLERFVDQLLTPKVPWQDILRKSLAKKLGRDTTNWNRPNRRRLVTQGVIMPTYRGFGAGHIVFCIDTSGSMSDDELSQALGECDKILMDCNPERVTLIGCDARVETVIELQPGDTLQHNIPRIGGGGGTSFIPPFDYLADEGEKPETLVYFTDTGGTFPEDPPAFPVIWCCSESWCEPPWGEVIHVEVG